MKARKFVLIYFKTVKATQSKKKKYSAIQSQHAANQNGFTPEQRKSRLQNKPGKFIGSRLCKLFEIVKVVAVCDLEVVLAI